jgi:hypothetical protein
MECEPVCVDILTTIRGVDFDAAWPCRVEDVFDEETNLRASFISVFTVAFLSQSNIVYRDVCEMAFLIRQILSWLIVFPGNR